MYDCPDKNNRFIVRNIVAWLGHLSFCADTSEKMDDAEDIVTYEEAVKSDERRIVFTGPRRYNRRLLEPPHRYLHSQHANALFITEPENQV